MFSEYNGGGDGHMDSRHHPHHGHDERKRRNYKLLVDPTIEPGAQKLYRFDGVAPSVSHVCCNRTSAVYVTCL